MSPITPAEAMAIRQSSIPDFVFEVVNDLIVKHLDSTGTAVVPQTEITDGIRQHAQYLAYDEPRPDIYVRGWVDVEDHYREIGWTVVYDRPAYYESYSPTFTFSS